MKTNEILDEIHRAREEHARECGYDVDVIFARMKERLKQLEAEGWKVTSPGPRETEVSYALHDKPHKKGK